MTRVKTSADILKCFMLFSGKGIFTLTLLITYKINYKNYEVLFYFLELFLNISINNLAHDLWAKTQYKHDIYSYVIYNEKLIENYT